MAFFLVKIVLYEENYFLVHTVAVTLSQSDINALNPAPNTDPAVLKYTNVVKVTYFVLCPLLVLAESLETNAS